MWIFNPSIEVHSEPSNTSMKMGRHCRLPFFVSGYLSVFFLIPPGIVCGAYAIRPYHDAKMLCDDLFFPITSVIVCGAYVICPYTDTKMLCDDSFYPISSVIVCGAYAIRPYTDTKMLCDDSFYPISSVIVCGAYAIRPYPTEWKRRCQNVFVALFEAQNLVKMFLRCFLRIKIE